MNSSTRFTRSAQTGNAISLLLGLLALGLLMYFMLKPSHPPAPAGGESLAPAADASGVRCEQQVSN